AHSMSLMDDLRQVPLLQSLSDQHLHDLASLGQTTELQAGQVVFGEGEAATQLYVILAGGVRVFKAGRFGEQIEISTAGPGQVFGEMAVLDGSVRSASVVTLASTVLFVIDREPFRGFLDQSP